MGPPSTPRAAFTAVLPVRSRRSFLKSSAALAGAALVAEGCVGAAPGEAARAEAAPGETAPGEAAGPLLAYVGTFSSPLRDVLPTQVDLPPGNGRGIHLFHVNRATGALTAAGVHELTTSPSCLVVSAAGNVLYSANETDRVGE